MENKNNAPTKKLSLAGKMSKIYIEHSQLNLLSILIIFVWGVTSFILMPKQYNPEIVAPAFSISVDFPGATSNEVYELVTRPLEDKAREIKEVDEIASSSYDGGKSVVMVRFLVGSDMEKAKISLNQKLSDGLSEKPLGAQNPSVVALDPDDVPIMTIGLTSPTLSESSLRKLAYDLSDEMKRTEGVSKVEVIGGKNNNLEIDLDTSKLAAYNLSISDISNIILSNNSAYTADQLKDSTGKEMLRISSAITDIESAKKIILASPNKNSTLTLGDVANITYGPGEITDHVNLVQKDSSDSLVYLAVSKLKQNNITSVSQAVRAQLESAKTSNELSQASATILRDEGQTAKEEIGTLTKHLFLSVIIVTVILMLFLGLRNALIVAIAIPLTLLASFGIGHLFGQTINRITLFALILALGLLVDDAIVIIENIHRFTMKNPGVSRRKLAVLAVDEVGMGVFMSTITVLLAFIPMVFVTGMMGPYMQPIPFFVSTTLLVSLFIAFTINPALTVIISSKETKHQDNIFIRTIGRVESFYARVLEKLILSKKKRRRFLWITALLFLLALLLPAFKVVQFRMLPKADKEQFYVYLDLPANTLLEKTNDVASIAENLALENPQVITVESTIGTPPVIDFNGMFKGSFARVGENQATLKINLVSASERKKTSEEIAFEMRNRILEKLADQPQVKVKIVEDPPGPPVRSTVFLKIQGNDSERLSLVAKDTQKLLKEISGTVDIDDSYAERSLEHSYKIDLEKAGRLGVSPTDIAQTIHLALSGADISRYRQTNKNNLRKPEQEFIILRAQNSNRENVSDLSDIYIKSNQGQMVSISELLTEKTDPTLPVIDSDQQEKTVYVRAEMAKRSVIYATLELFPKFFHYQLPDSNVKLSSWSPFGFSYGEGRDKINIQLDGEWKLTLEVFRDLGIAMGLSLFLIYFVLVIQLRSLVVPILIMITIPLALIGVLFGFAILHFTKGTFFNATSMIGVIALSGIVVKNAIIYLAYLYEMRDAKKTLSESLIESGRTRLLPILLTSLTAILGSLVIVSDPVWEGLAWSIIFGLSVSTVLTLVVFPLLYLEFEGKNWEKNNS